MAGIADPNAEADTHADASFRRHAADALILAGGGAAILLQLADPRVARGVAEHSGFREAPTQRLFGTLEYVYAVSSDEDALVRAAVAHVNAKHGPVRGAGYSAFDADAQRFVASTLTAVGIELEERLGGPLPPDVADHFVRRYGRLAAALQGGRAGWPGSRAEFDRWWHRQLATLDVGGDARAVAHALLTSVNVPWWLRAGQPVLRLLTAALLPEPLRSAYGFRWTPRTARVAGGWLSALAVVRRVVPAPIRALPMRRSLERLRARTEAGA